MEEYIHIKGAREHNLKNVDLKLPRNRLVCITGLSGSGKSSLAFDTIFAEGQRRYVESLSAYARQFLGQMQKPDVDEIEGLSPAISIDQKAHSANPRSTVATITEIYDYLRVLFARVGVPHCVKCEQLIQRLTVEEMVNLVIEEARRKSHVARRSGSTSDKRQATGNLKILAPVVRGRKGEYYQLLYDLYNSGFAKVRIDGKEYSLSEQIKLSRYQSHTIEVVIDTIPVDSLTAVTPDKTGVTSVSSSTNKDTRQRLADALETGLDRGHDVVQIVYPDKDEQLLSSEFSCPDCGFSFPEIEPRLFSFNSPYGACEACTGLGTEELFSEELCPVCEGARLRPEALHVLLPGLGKSHVANRTSTSDERRATGLSIVDITSMTIEQAVDYFNNFDLTERQREISGSVMKEVQGRLQFMLDVGLHYLTLDRKAGTLSGGEAQRIRLASQIGSRLVGALYVLDEPTIGLHQRDNDRLLETLEGLRDLGNSVIVVEHDEDTIRRSDYMVEFGPGAGVHGGEVVAEGPVPEIFAHKTSLTAAYLRGDKQIPMPKSRRAPGHDSIKIKGASENNLKNVNVEIPLRRMVCVTGVSGSGKSTLTNDIMYRELSRRLYGSKKKPGKFKEMFGTEYVDKAIRIDQSPIGRTPRSNPATYTGLWSPVRELFAATEEARFRGYKPGRFSFNTPGGRCENCEGHGQIAIEMHFLPTVYVQCEVCKGRRFDRETLEVEFKDKNIFDVLEMTIEDAAVFFKDIPPIADRLNTLKQVGLGYLKLGQPAPTLSGGEAQRVKLSAELAKRSTGKTLYLLDEPTVGLHFEDVKQLLEVLQALVDKGNTVIIIEHNLDVIKTADWIIDLGPDGGDRGGEVVGVGTPEDIVRNPKSHTGKYLRRYFKN
ncbi:MAG: excinuclease ABC subunit UvrA [Candidatus Uhrbacteria bacterium]|nr:excinuclease ABC subunit UvrA [Patescibacteria group bacterium]MBU1906648.1 excinuclease ABC subunit UvrA [Patescibacteria group bacterium]